MSWEEDLQTTNDGGDGDWSDKPEDDAGGSHDAEDGKEKEEDDEDGYEIGDKDLEADGVDEDLN